LNLTVPWKEVPLPSCPEESMAGPRFSPLRIMGAPGSEGIKILEGESGRIDLRGALETGWRVAMFGALIANGGRPTKIWIDGGHASHAEQSAAAVIREGDLLKVVGLGRIEAGVEAIESCERPIEKGVVSVQEVGDGPVLFDEAAGEKLGAKEPLNL
jgi:hypothetical protein